jgi:hypothetical protein
MAMVKRFINESAAVFVAIMFILPSGGCSKTKKVESDSTWTVTETVKLSGLTIADGASIKAPEGYSATLTVDGIETGQALEKWNGNQYKFLPGEYKGDIVLTVTKANNVTRVNVDSGAGGGMQGRSNAGGPDVARGAAAEGAIGADAGASGGGAPATASVAADIATRANKVYAFRQALYLDKDGIDYSKSVLAAVKGEKPTGFNIGNIEIKSNGTLYKDATSCGGTAFTGIYAAGGEYNIKNVKINFFGDGLNDFIGDGAAIVAAGKGTRLVLDNVTIDNQGVVRAGVIAKDGSKVIVKNSTIDCENGVLPPDDPWGQSGEMRSTLWISGMKGNVRATSVLGEDTQATYINSSIASGGWGVLSTDGTKNVYLTAINSKVSLKGDSGYGNYNDPDAHVAYYGCEFEMATFASAIGSGDVYYGDSTPEAIAELNKKFGLGLTDEELKSIPSKATVINSKKYAVMWHRSGNPLTVDGGTTFNTAKTAFIVSGVPAVLNMDGAGGAGINAGNGVIMQVASDDQPEGMGRGDAGYEEPTTAPQPAAGFDNTSVKDAATANFSNINLKGDFYNSVGWGRLTDKLNLALNFKNSKITGIISASESHHPAPRILKANQYDFHSITDKVQPAVNNGVIVNLTDGSTWTVTGTSYLTGLMIADGSSVTAPEGYRAVMTVNGTQKEIKPGSYSGKIELTTIK